MADISITPASVLPDLTGDIRTGTAGATIVAGNVVYFDAATSTYKLADANSSAATAAAVGVAVCGAAAGQKVSVQYSGSITLGAVLTQGLIYVASATAGAMAPSADLASGYYAAILGTATSTSVLKMPTGGVHFSGVVV